KKEDSHQIVLNEIIKFEAKVIDYQKSVLARCKIMEAQAQPLTALEGLIRAETLRRECQQDMMKLKEEIIPYATILVKSIAAEAEKIRADNGPKDAKDKLSESQRRYAILNERFLKGMKTLERIYEAVETPVRKLYVSAGLTPDF
ncbi:MAG: hypothetical protein OJI67_09545, partial [Prosthecobacter sp.]|nr:hypothetical protein [Prosthecobacter sp.]